MTKPQKCRPWKEDPYLSTPHMTPFKKVWGGGNKFQCIANATMKTIDRGETTHMTCLVIHSISHPSTLSYLVCLRSNHSNNNSRSYLLNMSDTKACCFCCCMQLTQMSPCQCFYISLWVCLYSCVQLNHFVRECMQRFSEENFNLSIHNSWTWDNLYF